MKGASRRLLSDLAHRAMRERGLVPDFPPEALAELDAVARAPQETDASIRDLRALAWASVDNDESRDLDQLSVAREESGAVVVLVAIADVDTRVKQGGAIDARARTNTTSVYTAAETFHMLPQQISTGLTSLNPGEDRLAMVVQFRVDAGGEVSQPLICRALVHNHAKLNYDGVAAWLGGGPVPPALAAVPGLEDNLRLQCRAAQSMRRRRHRLGALTLKMVQAKPVYENGVLVDLRAEEANVAREMIEEFMIAANGATATFLEERGFASIRRVLERPARWDRIVELARDLGETLPPEPDARALQAFLLKRGEAAPDRFAELSVSIVKLLGGGEYAVDAPGRRTEGHFGLAVSDYTHSTAPNRRFPDLVTQRLLKAALAKRDMPYALAVLDALAKHCTLQADNASKVERQVRKSAAAVLLQPRLGEAFDAMVTGAAPKGTWVRIFRPAAEGRVVKGFEGLDVGDRLRVRLVATDVERGFVDFARAE